MGRRTPTSWSLRSSVRQRRWKAYGGGRTATDPYVAGLVRSCNVLEYGDALLGPVPEGALDDAYRTATGERREAFDAAVGACFPLLGSESVASVVARDVHAPTVHVRYVLVTPEDEADVRGSFCDAAELPIPPTAYRLEAYVRPVGGCGGPGEGATTGTVTVTFT